MEVKHKREHSRHLLTQLIHSARMVKACLSKFCRSGWRAPACVLLLALSWDGAVRAEPPSRSPVDLKRGELTRLRSEITVSQEAQKRLRQEIRDLNADAAKLKSELVRVAGQARERERKVLDSEKRLEDLLGTEAQISASLVARRGVLSDLLATLQRLDRQPPPALLVHPNDAMKAVRSSMLLAALLPQIRHETGALAASLADLARLRQDIVAGRDMLRAELQTLAEDRQRMDLMIIERRKDVASHRRTMEEERQKAAALAKEASSLADLIARMERDPARQAALDPTDPRTILPHPSTPLPGDPARLAPALAFDQAQGLLPLPVVGSVVRRFGQNDGLGGQEKGMTLATEPLASVLAPCDGWIVYAGPFRSYGQILIIDAGSGYHVVLAGMDKINAELGQFVLTGEPVAFMGSGETRVAGLESAADAAPASMQPALYIEFRKGGNSIDPTPWWAQQSEKVRG